MNGSVRTKAALIVDCGDVQKTSTMIEITRNSSKSIDLLTELCHADTSDIIGDRSKRCFDQELAGVLELRLRTAP